MTSVNIMAPGIRVDNDLAGDYYIHAGMVEAVHQQLVNELSRFVNKNLLLIVADMKRDWWNAKTFLLWVNEKKNKRLVPMDRECQGSL